MDADTMKAGLLMEAAEAHQQLATAALKRLDATTRGLEPAVRDAVAQAVAAAVRAELGQVRNEAHSTVQTLQVVRGRMSWDVNIMACGVAAVGALAAVAGLYAAGWIDTARAPRQLPVMLQGESGVLDEFERRGVRVDVALCGKERAPCVRVDPKSPTYGQRKDAYLLLPAAR